MQKYQPSLPSMNVADAEAALANAKSRHAEAERRRLEAGEACGAAVRSFNDRVREIERQWTERSELIDRRLRAIEFNGASASPNERHQLVKDKELFAQRRIAEMNSLEAAHLDKIEQLKIASWNADQNAGAASEKVAFCESVLTESRRIADAEARLARLEGKPTQAETMQAEADEMVRRCIEAGRAAALAGMSLK